MSLVLTSASHICTSSKNTDQFGKAINYLGKHPKALSLHLIGKMNPVNSSGYPLSNYSFSSRCRPGLTPRMKKICQNLRSTQKTDFSFVVISSLLFPSRNQSLLPWIPPKPSLCTTSSWRHRLYYLCQLKKSQSLKTVPAKLLLQLLFPFKTFVFNSLTK